MGNKCRSQTGASLLVALLFFLLCSLAGSAILAAASTTTEDLKRRKEVKQTEYAVLSAARVLRKELQTGPEKGNCSGFCAVVTYKDDDPPDPEFTLNGPASASGILKEILTEASQAVLGDFDEDGIKNLKTQFDGTIQVESSSRSPYARLGVVNFHFEMNDAFGITIDLSQSYKNEGTGGVHYRLTAQPDVEIKEYEYVERNEEGEEISTTITITTDVKWISTEIIRAEGG